MLDLTRLPADVPLWLTQPNSTDAYMQLRMLGVILPLIDATSSAAWLTIGDGKYGSDAAFFKRQGVDVLASSLDTEKLEIAHELGLIDKYSKINAESIDLPDSCVDYVLCKQAYHHFPHAR